MMEYAIIFDVVEWLLLLAQTLTLCLFILYFTLYLRRFGKSTDLLNILTFVAIITGLSIHVVLRFVSQISILVVEHISLYDYFKGTECPNNTKCNTKFGIQYEMSVQVPNYFLNLALLLNGLKWCITINRLKHIEFNRD